MRPALLPQRESGAVLYSSHAHCKNIREQIQTTPALPTQEYTRAGADHPRAPDAEIHGSRCRPPPALPTQKYTGACSDRPALHSFPTHTAAARAIACRLSLPGHCVRA